LFIDVHAHLKPHYSWMAKLLWEGEIISGGQGSRRAEGMAGNVGVSNGSAGASPSQYQLRLVNKGIIPLEIRETIGEIARRSKRRVIVV
jgi:hypothetical protein